jgi:hypothetical protein
MFNFDPDTLRGWIASLDCSRGLNRLVPKTRIFCDVEPLAPLTSQAGYSELYARKKKLA